MALFRCGAGGKFKKYASVMAGQNTGYAIVTYDNGSGIDIQTGNSDVTFGNSDLVTIQHVSAGNTHEVTFKENCHVIYGYGTTTFEGDKSANDTISINAQNSGYTLFAYTI